MLGLSVADWIVVFVYLVLVTFLGVMAYRKVKDRADFFMGGRRFGKIFMMFFAFGAGTSSEQANSVVAGTWRAGLAGIWWQFLWLWATPFYWIVAPVLRRMRALTTSDFFEARFDQGTSKLYAAWGIIMAIVFISGALYGSGKMVDALTGDQLTNVADKQLADYKFVPQVERVNIDPNDAGSDAPTRRTIVFRAIKGYEIAILAITVLFVTYGMAGGLGAAIWTDFIQGILTIAFSFLLLPFIFAKIGGAAALNPEGTEPVKHGMFDLVASADIAEILNREPITTFYVFMLSLTALVGIVVQPHIMGVCGAGKTEFEGRFGFTFGNFIKRFCTIAWTFTALACIVWYLGSDSPLLAFDRLDDTQRAELKEQNPVVYDKLLRDKETYERVSLMNARVRADEYQNLSEDEQEELKNLDKEFADKLFGRAAHDILPGIAPGLIGLLLASLLAAMMSTCDAQMIVASGLFTENLYKPLIKPNASEHHYLWVGRFAGLAVVILALILQTTFTDVIHALRVILKTPALIGISLWIGIAWRGWTPIAVWVSSSVATVVWAICEFWPSVVAQITPLSFMLRETGNNPIVYDAWTNVALLSAGLISGILVSWVTPRTSPEKLDHFFRLMRTPVTPGEVIAEPCTLPDDPAEPVGKLINHPDIEIPKPTKTDALGFLAAWVCVGLIIALTYWLASPS